VDEAKILSDNEGGIRYSLKRIINGHRWLEQDILQEARIYVLYCHRKYDPSANSSFINYYIKYIRHKVRRFALEFSRASSVKLTFKSSKLFYNSFRIERRAFSECDESEENKRKIAIEFGVDPGWLDGQNVTTLLDRTNYKDNPDYQFNEDLQEKFSDPTILWEPKNQEDHMNSLDSIRIMDEFMSSLKERDRYIFSVRFIEDEPHTLQSIGDKYGISRERARQLEERLIIKFKEFCKEKDYI